MNKKWTVPVVWVGKTSGENYAKCKCRKGHLTSLFKALRVYGPDHWGLSKKEIAGCIASFRYNCGPIILEAIRNNWVDCWDGKKLLLQQANFDSLCKAHRAWPELFDKRELLGYMPDINQMVKLHHRADLYQARLVFPEFISDEIVRSSFDDEELKWMSVRICKYNEHKNTISDKLFRTLPNWKDLLVVYQVMND